MDEFDVIVVGAGSSGAALATRLSERASRSVLLLEAGASYDSIDRFPPELLDPADMTSSMPGHPSNWSPMGSLMPGFSTPIPRGKVVGGSGSLNGAYFVRATKADHDRWSAAGNDRWSWEESLPFYKRSESDRDFQNAAHGTEGPIVVKRASHDRAPEFTEGFTRACLELGFPEESDKNDEGVGGVGPVPLNVHDGVRVSSAIGYLLPNLGRPNLCVRGNAFVRRVVFEGSRAVGVEVDLEGKRQTVRAEEVVIASGALRTPQLLMLSGIGPGDHLREHGIDVLHDSQGVGRNLMDHPEIMAPYEFDVEMPNMPGRGLMTSALNWTAKDSPCATDLEILPFVTAMGDSMDKMSPLRHPLKTLRAMRGMSLKALRSQTRARALPFIVMGVMQVESRGSVELASADPETNPTIQHGFLEPESDRRRFREAATVLNELFRTKHLRSHSGEVQGLATAVGGGADELDHWIKGHLFLAGHPSCTCKMGSAADETAVVDQYARVHGVERLRVVDTSIFPSVPTRGPNATAIMFGERVAAFFDEESARTGSAPSEREGTCEV